MNFPDRPSHGLLATWLQDGPFLTGALLCAAAAYGLMSLAWPPGPGVDLRSYLEYYFDLGPDVRLFRTWGSAQILGWMVQLNYSNFKLTAMFCYLLMVASVYYVASPFGRVAARVATIVIILHFDLNGLFHHVSSDMLASLGTMALSVLLVRFHRTPRLLAAVLLGAFTFLTVLLRPASMLFVVLGLYPLVSLGINRRNGMLSLVFLITFTAGWLGYCGYNWFNYGVFSLTKINTQLYWPAYSLFMRNPMFSRDNGPVSQELFDQVERILLSQEIYRTHGIDTEQFFHKRDIRMWSDLNYLDSLQPGLVRKAAFEAIHKNPMGFLLRSMILPFYHLMTDDDHLSLPLPLPETVPPTNHGLEKSFNSTLKDDIHGHTTVSNDRPAKWSASEVERKLKMIDGLVNGLIKKGDYQTGYLIKTLLIPIMPPMLLFLGAAVLLLGRWRETNVRLLLLLLMAVTAVIAANAQFAHMVRLRLPYDPILIIGGLVGLKGHSYFRKILMLDRSHGQARD
ncbi:MAG: hypothetical protein HQL73_01115 [Magnetococcales bacterium]|nr:hypothetical protein [Magnetococcales bacterium]